MSPKNRAPRFSRLRGILAVVVVIALMGWFATENREALTKVYSTITDGLPNSSQAQSVPEGQWLESGPTSIGPQQLASLDVAEQDRSEDDYERDAFGDGWASVGDGCDTRDQILNRDLVEITYENGSDCEATDGILHDPYTGTTIEGNLSEDVQIDHIVSLGDAWYSGAEDWSAQKREAFANDPANLVAVDAPANMSKSDDSISEWYPDWDAPSETAECRYAAQYVDVLATYDLSVTRDDYKLLKKLETDCKRLT
ncbi:MAG TPA: HNH endonuclease family protein [Jiangellaceae bacterium]|nr:HNH endonuclease family protein [Jiangellaceae bacterium]